ncbi:hypothetical protein ALC53_07603, partial [Atta colombica]
KERQNASRAGTQRKSKKKKRVNGEIESMRWRWFRYLPIPSYSSPKKRVFKRQSADVTTVWVRYTGQSREDMDEKKREKKEEKVDAVREFVTCDEELEKEKKGESCARNGRGML